jgi:hypothetical protein
MPAGEAPKAKAKSKPKAKTKKLSVNCAHADASELGQSSSAPSGDSKEVAEKVKVSEVHIAGSPKPKAKQKPKKSTSGGEPSPRSGGNSPCAKHAGGTSPKAKPKAKKKKVDAAKQVEGAEGDGVAESELCGEAEETSDFHLRVPGASGMEFGAAEAEHGQDDDLTVGHSLTDASRGSLIDLGLGADESTALEKAGSAYSLRTAGSMEFSACIEGLRRSIQKHEEPVVLRIYDLGSSRGFSVKVVNTLLKPLGTGAYHVGIEVYGEEWSYGSCDEENATGVFFCKPSKCGAHHYRSAVTLGKTRVSSFEFSDMVTWMKEDWLGKDYDLINRNCITFCNTLAEQLKVSALPAWVSSLPNVLKKKKYDDGPSRNNLRLGKNGVTMDANNKMALAMTMSEPMPGAGRCILCSGWLEKRGPIASYKWTRVWCVMDQRSLAYYENNTCKVKKGELSLSQVDRVISFKSAEKGEEARSYAEDRPYGFTIIFCDFSRDDTEPRGPRSSFGSHATTQRSYYFDALDDPSFSKWMTSLVLGRGGDSDSEMDFAMSSQIQQDRSNSSPTLNTDGQGSAFSAADFRSNRPPLLNTDGQGIAISVSEFRSNRES